MTLAEPRSNISVAKADTSRDLVVLIACLVIGSVLRLLWSADMEWKGDEAWMFTHALEMARHGSLPWIGMPSSAGPPHAGFSIWPFILFAKLSPTPVGVVQWVQWINVIALCGFGAFAAFRTPAHNRRTWMWGVALFAVSPLPILFSRKIWIPDVLPLFGMALLWAHSYRRNPFAAFAWGLLGALLGQVHLSGFFFAFALFVVTVARRSTREGMTAAAWISWLIGSVLGATIMIPWTLSLFGPHHHAVAASAKYIASLRFFTGAFLTAWGIDLQYSLRTFFWSDFVRMPCVGGHPTYLIGAVHAILAILSLYTIGTWIKRRFQLGGDDALTLYLTVVLVTGIIMTLSMVKVRVHYLVVVSPFLHIWIAAMLRDRRKLLATVTALHLVVSVAFLATVHSRGDIPRSDYGTTYRVQPNPTRPAAPLPPSD